MGVKFANSAYATLASSITSSATSITLTTGQGARFPSLSGSDYFYATLIDTSNNLEIVKCTARSTDVLTVVRGQESTTARAYSAGDRIELRITAQSIVDVVNTLVETGVLAVPGTSSSPAILRLAEDTDNGTNYIGLKAPASVGSNLEFTLPSADGSSGQFLKTDGSGVLSFASVTQKVLNVWQATKTDVQSLTNTTTFTDITGLSITVTPASSSSKFLLLAEINGAAEDDGGKFRFSGGNSTSSVGDAAGSRQRVHNSWCLYSYNAITMMNGFGMYLDSPATTSSITYVCQFASDDQTTWINRSKADADGIYYPRGVSNFVVVELAS